MKTRPKNNLPKRSKVPAFLRSYLDAALFTTDAEPLSGQDYVQCGRSADMYASFPQYFVDKARIDCHTFALACHEYLAKAGDDEQNGADYWYTRNGHGVGFWDRGYDDHLAEVLTVASEAAGTHDLDLIDLEQDERE